MEIPISVKWPWLQSYRRFHIQGTQKIFELIYVANNNYWVCLLNNYCMEYIIHFNMSLENLTLDVLDM